MSGVNSIHIPNDTSLKYINLGTTSYILKIREYKDKKRTKAREKKHRRRNMCKDKIEVM